MLNSPQRPAEGIQSLALGQVAARAGKRLHEPVMPPEAQATGNGNAGAGFRPLSLQLQTIPLETLEEARRRAAGRDRDELLDKFRNAFAGGKLLAAFILADELIAREIPPCMWHHHLSSTDYSLDQRYLMTVADFRWLRSWHLEHVKRVRYQQYQLLFSPHEPAFHRAAEYVFYQGQRPPWKIVASLSLDERQQWSCARLRSEPVKRRHAETQAMRERVFQALQDDLRTVRRTATFDDNDAQTSLLRRFNLWLCARMTGGSPTETALRFLQMTGQEISRQAAAMQLYKIAGTLVEKSIMANKKKRARIV